MVKCQFDDLAYKYIVISILFSRVFNGLKISNIFRQSISHFQGNVLTSGSRYTHIRVA